MAVQDVLLPIKPCAVNLVDFLSVLSVCVYVSLCLFVSSICHVFFICFSDLAHAQENANRHGSRVQTHCLVEFDCQNETDHALEVTAAVEGSVVWCVDSNVRLK